MCTLILLFFIISPIVILYTAGYRYDFETRQILQTGVISIDVEPRSATVTLSDVPLHKRMPLRLTNRAPGNYRLRIAADGYHPWEQVIPVGSKQTTYIRDIELFQIALPVRLDDISEQLRQSRTHTLYASPRTAHYIIHTTEDTLHEIGLYDAASTEYISLIRTAARDVVQITWSPYTSAAAVTLDTPTQGVTTYYIDIQSSTISRPFTTINTPSLYWNAQDAGSVYAYDTIRWSRLTRTEAETLPTDPDTQYIPSPGRIDTWYQRRADQLLEDPKTNATIQFGTSIDAIVAIRGNTLIAMRGSDLLRFTLSQGQAILEETISDGSLLEKNNTLYLINPWSISTVDTSGQTALLLRTSNRILHTALFPAERTELLLTTESGITVFDARYNTSIPLLTDLQTDDMQSAVVVPDSNAIIWYGAVGRQSGLFTLDI